MTSRKLLLPLIGLLFVPIALSLLSADPEEEEQRQALLGLWARFSPEKEGDPVRFYYFHEGGIGLYRYGRMGLNNTHSYTWTRKGDRLLLKFNKSGRVAEARLRFDIDPDGVPVVVLEDDPYEPRPTRYRKQGPPMEEAAVDEDARDEHPFARMWVHQMKYATGGMGFSIYQFKPPALDGRGVGWFHTGDFDNWSTETLMYRRTGDKLELIFPLRQERQLTRMTIDQAGDHRVMALTQDPRNFWHRQVYVDGGASFGVSTLSLPGGPPPLDTLVRPSQRTPAGEQQEASR